MEGRTFPAQETRFASPQITLQMKERVSGYWVSSASSRALHTHCHWTEWEWKDAESRAGGGGDQGFDIISFVLTFAFCISLHRWYPALLTR